MRTIFCLSLWLLLISLPASAQTPVTVVIGGKPVPLIVSPYVGRDGQVFAPVDAVRLMGASYSPDTDAQTVTVTGRDSRAVTVPYELVQGRDCIPLLKVAQALGADADWQPKTQTLTVRARLLMVRQEGDALTIDTSYPVYSHVQHLDNPRRLFVDLYGLDLAAQPATLPVTSDSVSRVRTGQMDFNTVRVVIDLKRDIAFQVQSQPETDRVQVALGSGGLPSSVVPIPITPPVAAALDPGVHITEEGPPDPNNGGKERDSGPPTLLPSLGVGRSLGDGGSLAGKIIVIDPGHGHQDSGAVGLGGAMEKTFTLAIGLKLRDALRRSGATVYMTRDSDTFLPVMDRARFGIAHDADLFISIHCDSSGPDNSHSGTTVYFHAQNPICRRYAADISARIAEVSGIPQVGIKSDTIRFAQGFGVLRGSPMPAVLIECGYVNSAADLPKLQDPNTQEKIAEGIVAGMNDFLGSHTASRRLYHIHDTHSHH